MSIVWRPRGLLLAAPADRPWSRTHAALPAPYSVGEGGFEMAFSGRDDRGRAHVSAVDVAWAEHGPAADAGSIRELLAPGELGTFDDCGTTVSCLVEHGGATYLYYSGWSQARAVPFTFHVGLAISEDGRTFRRASRAPILERTQDEPFMTASPFVIVDRTGWRMWYVSCTGWIDAPAGPQHRYHLRSARSRDGITWERDGTVAVDCRGPGEHSIARPWVVRDADRWRMWFSARGEEYRLGYAESTDGNDWIRDDARAGLDPGPPGAFDDRSIAYPAVVDGPQGRILLYNGNAYGRAGIGWADAA